MTTPHKPAMFSILLFTLAVGASVCPAGEAGFGHVCSWATFDPGDQGVRDESDTYDGDVDLSDLAALLGAYGTDCP
jgi:hypothetical protein